MADRLFAGFLLIVTLAYGYHRMDDHLGTVPVRSPGPRKLAAHPVRVWPFPAFSTSSGGLTPNPLP